MNCKPGDLAIVIKSDYPADIGMIVRVVGPAADAWVHDDVPEWLVESDRISVVADYDTGTEKLSLDFDIPDAWLRPISGLPVDEETRDEVTA